MTGYLRPVDPTNGRICTWLTHTQRIPPSQEAGVDYYTPIGTPVHAAEAGTVYQTGGGILPATGRFLTIDLDDGRRVRYLHLSKWLKKAGDRVQRGDVVALSGASGYGSEFFGAADLAHIPANTGGPHVHTTLWASHTYTFGPTAGTLDFEKYADHSAVTGGGVTPFDPNTNASEEEDMFTIYNNGGSYMIVGSDIFLEVGQSLTNLTGVDGAETVNQFLAAGAKQVQLDPRAYDVLRVNIRAGRPATSVDANALAAALQAAGVGGVTLDQLNTALSHLFIGIKQP